MTTLEALRADILMWRKVRITSDLNEIKPALCKLHLHGGCYGCPVFNATHSPLCLNTPVGKTTLAEMLFDPTPHADRQVKFLETLLPKEI